MKDLKVTKERISNQWQDDKLREFESNFLEPLETLLRGTVTSIADLADILQKADRDVGDY
jgi:hypothetical protein